MKIDLSGHDYFTFNIKITEHKIRATHLPFKKNNDFQKCFLCVKNYDYATYAEICKQGMMNTILNQFTRMVNVKCNLYPFNKLQVTTR